MVINYTALLYDLNRLLNGVEFNFKSLKSLLYQNSSGKIIMSDFS